MIFSNRMPKERKFGIPKNSKKEYRNNCKKANRRNKSLCLRGSENFSHAKLREVQRYGTLNVKEKEIIRDIKNDNAVIIEQQKSIIKAIVRYSTRYYYVVYDYEINKIKTFLPDDSIDFIDCVQRLIDKVNEIVEEKAA